MRKGTLLKSDIFELKTKRVKNPNKRGKGHPHYVISAKWWHLSDEEEEQVRDVVDPLRNISGKRGQSWTFKDYREAERKYLMLILRWS